MDAGTIRFERRSTRRIKVGDVPIGEFLFGTVWTPLFYDKHFGVIPLVTGTLLASTSGEEVTVWNAGTGDVVHLLRGHKGLVSCVAFSADGTRLASGGSDKAVRLWSVKDGTSAGQLLGHRDRVTVLLPMPGGGLMSASADGSVRTWSTAD